MNPIISHPPNIFIISPGRWSDHAGDPSRLLRIRAHGQANVARAGLPGRMAGPWPSFIMGLG